MWFSNVKLSFYIWNPTCFFFFFLQSKDTTFLQEAALILYIYEKLSVLLGIFRVLFWKEVLVPLDLFY